MRALIMFLAAAVVLLFSAATVAEEATSDAAFPVISTFQELVDVNCPFLDSCQAELATGDNQLLGVEFDGTHYWVTDGGSQAHGGTNYLEQIDRNCNLVDSCSQNSTSWWGIRDLAWDWSRDSLYGSDDYGLYIFDNSCPVVLNNLVPPAGYPLPMRALAWDPVTDHLWGANLSNDVIEWDPRTGEIFCRASHSWWAYGMAWDDKCYSTLGYDYPMLWVHSQNWDPMLRMELFDPVACRYTGDFCIGIDPNGANDDMAGGLAFDGEGNYVAGVGALIAMNQGTPQDIIMAYNICDLSVEVGRPEKSLPTVTSLAQNHPNPFNANTVISYELPAVANVKLEVYNLLGERVATLVNSKQQAGYRSVNWDASGVSSGLYFYRLTAGSKVFSDRMTLLK